jgi:hypothetical protein
VAKVRRVSYVQVGGQRVPVKKVMSIAPVLARATAEATATQLRVLAEETRELILDKLFAGPGRAVVQRPLKIRPAPPGANRTPFRHRALSERHARKKERKGLDGRKLIETGNYLENIEVFRGEQQSGVYFMLRPKRAKHVGEDPSSGEISFATLARVHEFGSARHGIPARPHWGPAIRAALRRFRQLPAEVRAAALRAALREIA